MKRFHFLQVCFVLPLTFIPLISISQNGNSNPNAQGNGQWKTNGNQANPDHFIGTVNERDVIFKSNNEERLRITPEGNIGIGTSTPSTLLDVNGNVTLRNDLLLPGIPSNPYADEVLIIDALGQVKKAGGDALGALIYKDKGCSGAFIQAPTWSNGIGKIYVNCPEVNVGINTNSPLYRLDVRGNSYFQGAMGVGAEPAVSEVQLLVKTQANRAVGLCLNHEVNDPNTFGYKIIVHDETTKGFVMYSQVLDKEIFTVHANGQMTISNDQEKILQLEANGLLRSRQIKIDLDSWADYVFEENYALMPLNELGEFVRKEGHLPNIPSEAELKESGLDVAEMNRLLMEKVEELTLYLIQMEEKNAAQQAQIDALMKKD